MFASVGDLFDRGPNSKLVYKIAVINNMYVTMGNHDNKLLRFALGNNIKIRNGLQRTINDFGWKTHKDVPDEIITYLQNMPYKIENEMFQILHAQPGDSDNLNIRGESREFMDQKLRWNWWSEWNGILTVFGHYWFDEPVIEIRDGRPVAIGIDTSCVRGGKLTALVLPHFDLVSVDAHAMYSEQDSELHEKLSIQEKEAWKYWAKKENTNA